MTLPLKIDAIYAWIGTHPDGQEGIPAIKGTLDGKTLALPLMGADMERIESLRPYAVACAEEMGLPMKLVRFTTLEILEQIEPTRKAGRA